MQCPSCSKSQPMSFQCQFCGAEFIRRRGAAFATAAAVAGPAPQSAAAAIALDNPYEAPEGMSQAPVRVSYGEQALASPFSRLAAHFVDGLIALAVYLPMLLAFIIGGEPDSGFLGIATMITVVGLLVLVVYQLRLLSSDGQTLGKRAMKVRVVMYDDGSNPGFGRAVGLRLFVNGLIGIIPGYALVDVLFIFGAERRCLHDFVAGTKVVEA